MLFTAADDAGTGDPHSISAIKRLKDFSSSSEVPLAPASFSADKAAVNATSLSFVFRYKGVTISSSLPFTTHFLRKLRMAVTPLPPAAVQPWTEASHTEVYLHLALATLVTYDARELSSYFYLLLLSHVTILFGPSLDLGQRSML